VLGISSFVSEARRSGTRIVAIGIAAIVAILLVAAILLFTNLPDANVFNQRVEQIFVANDDLTSNAEIKLLEILAASGTAFSGVLESYRVVIFVLLVFASALLVAALVFLVTIIALNRRMGEIERAGRARLSLASGAGIVVETTEALTSIDVNSSSYTGRSHLEDTAFATNMEAVAEVVRQIRLRNIGGLIVVDFIHMADDARWDEVVGARVLSPVDYLVGSCRRLGLDPPPIVEPDVRAQSHHPKKHEEDHRDDLLLRVLAGHGVLVRCPTRCTERSAGGCSGCPW